MSIIQSRSPSYNLTFFCFLLLALALALIFLLLGGKAEAQLQYPAKSTANVFTNTNQFTSGIYLGPQVFANLSSLVGVTNIVYISDGVAGSNPCLGSGTGALAVYTGGQWNCGGTSSASGITVNGGSILPSPVNFQSGTNTTATNPSGSNVQFNVPSSTSSVLGVIELTGDFGGSATAPTVVNGSNLTNASIANSGLAHPTLTVTAGTGLSGGGAVALGSSTTLNIASTVTSGSCSLCNLNYNAEGQITGASSGNPSGTTAPAWIANWEGSPYVPAANTNGSFENISTANLMSFFTIQLTRPFSFNTLTFRIAAGIAGSSVGIALYGPLNGTTPTCATAPRLVYWSSLSTVNNNVTVSAAATSGAQLAQPGVYCWGYAASTTSGVTTQGSLVNAQSGESIAPWNANQTRSGTAANSMVSGVPPTTLGTLASGSGFNNGGTNNPYWIVEP